MDDNNFENEYPPSNGDLQDWLNSWREEEEEE